MSGRTYRPDGSGESFPSGDINGYFDSDSPIAQTASVLTGFDREAPEVSASNKNTGIMQYCHSASSGDVHQIGSDADGTYSLLTSQTTFADGTALADRTLMQYHDSGETQFSYWYKGNFIEVTTAKFIQLDTDFEGYIYYTEDGDLHVGETDAKELIIRTTLIAYIYLNPTEDKIIWFADERHGIVMDGQTHLQQHMSQGFFRVNGLEAVGIANNVTHFTSVSAGRGGDEDIQMTFAEVTTMPKMFLEVGYWNVTDEDNKLGIFRDNKCCYNYVDVVGSEILTEINADYVIMMMIATNNKIHPFIMLVGQELHDNRGDARDNLPAEYYRIQANGLPSHEFSQLTAMIVHNESTGQIEVGADGEIYIDWKHGFPMSVF